MRVVEKIDRRPGWLMARRGVGAGDHAKADLYLSNAPETVALAEMAWVGCPGWAIEVDFELAKGRIGLDHHEVTKYQGWYQHTTLCLLALALLKSVQFASVPEVRQPLQVVVARVDWNPGTRDRPVARSTTPQSCRPSQSQTALAPSAPAMSNQPCSTRVARAKSKTHPG